MIYENIVQTIGKTPIVRINSVHEEGMAEIYAKLEFFNPGGSVKDRIAASMILGMQKEEIFLSGEKRKIIVQVLDILEFSLTKIELFTVTILQMEFLWIITIDCGFMQADHIILYID